MLDLVMPPSISVTVNWIWAVVPCFMNWIQTKTSTRSRNSEFCIGLGNWTTFHKTHSITYLYLWKDRPLTSNNSVRILKLKSTQKLCGIHMFRIWKNKWLFLWMAITALLCQYLCATLLSHDLPTLEMSIGLNKLYGHWIALCPTWHTLCQLISNATCWRVMVIGIVHCMTWVWNKYNWKPNNIY